MALFKEGDKVLHVDSKEHGFIVTVKPPRRGGHQNYIVSWGNRADCKGGITIGKRQSIVSSLCSSILYLT